MINIGLLLDVCGISYTEKQLTSLQKLVNDIVLKYTTKNLHEKDSDSADFLHDQWGKYEDFNDNTKRESLEKQNVEIKEEIYQGSYGNIRYVIQPWPFAYVWLLNKLYENKVTFRGQNIPLNYCHPLQLILYFEKGVISFGIFDIESLGQRAAKLRLLNFENCSDL